MTAVPALHPLITTARAWYDAGYCVVPSHEDGGKRPFGPWKQYQTQRPTWEQVETWLTTGPYTGIGVLTGAASGNAEMLELEGPLDQAAQRFEAVLKQAQDYAEIGVPELLARVGTGCVEQSAGGGLHLFITVTDGPATGNTKLAFTGQGPERKVIAETRGQGGFVVVAPTPARNGHPDGSTYQFINGGHPSKTVAVTSEERDLLHMLFTLALNEEDQAEVAAMLVQQADPRPRTDTPSTFDQFREATWQSILEPAGWTWSHRDGERDHWTRPGKTVKDGTSATTIDDGPMYVFSTNAGMPTEVGLSKAQVFAHLHHGGDLSAAARALRAEGYGQTPIYDLPPWEAVLDPDASEEEREDAAATWISEHLPRLDWHQLWANDHQEEWIVEPLLAARRLVALYSAPKVGKSLLMLELAAAIANGRGMFGYTAPARAYRTLYVDFENDPQADIRERLQAMGYGPDDLDNLVLLSFPTLAKLDTARGAQELLAAIAHYRTEIVVIDTVSRAVQGEENENDTWLNFYKHTGLRLKQAGVALIRLDHAGKDETKGQRGGSAKSGDVDAVWRMSREGDDTFDLTCEAQRFPIHETRLTVRRVDDENGLRHEVISNPGRDKEQTLVAALVEHRIDKTLSRTAAGTALRAAGHAFKGRLPERAWQQYQAIPAPFSVVQEAM